MFRPWTIIQLNASDTPDQQISKRLRLFLNSYSAFTFNYRSEKEYHEEMSYMVDGIMDEGPMFDEVIYDTSATIEVNTYPTEIMVSSPDYDLDYAMDFGDDTPF
jgi:hypothetical protein